MSTALFTKGELAVTVAILAGGAYAAHRFIDQMLVNSFRHGRQDAMRRVERTLVSDGQLRLLVGEYRE